MKGYGERERFQEKAIKTKLGQKERYDENGNDNGSGVEKDNGNNFNRQQFIKNI